ncbi:MAG: uracil-xanthine permease, partial [Eubacteriales bacterium]|nr:uracil-xanthine permease [Eubacteriales bacterium]
MLKNVDLGENENLFVVSAILVTGIGGLVLQFGQIQISSIATALIVGILTKLIVGGKKKTAVADENKENKEAK